MKDSRMKLKCRAERRAIFMARHGDVGRLIKVNLLVEDVAINILVDGLKALTRVAMIQFDNKFFPICRVIRARN